MIKHGSTCPAVSPFGNIPLTEDLYLNLFLSEIVSDTHLSIWSLKSISSSLSKSQQNAIFQSRLFSECFRLPFYWFELYTVSLQKQVATMQSSKPFLQQKLCFNNNPHSKVQTKRGTTMNDNLGTYLLRYQLYKMYNRYNFYDIVL